jgi:hypothetical protein
MSVKNCKTSHFLPDPLHLLRGDRKAKKYIPLYSYTDVPWDYLKELIHLHAQFDPGS